MSSDIKATFERCLASIEDLTALLNEIPTDNWNLFSVQRYCEKYIEAFRAEEFEKHMLQENNISNYNFTSLFDSIECYRERLTNVLSDLSEWDNYNSQYRSHLVGISDSIEKNIGEYKRCFNVTGWQTGLFLSEVHNGLIRLSKCFEDSTEELYEQFKYGNKNYIVFGKNGAGKTTLLKKISSEIINTNSFVIPADRSVLYKVSQVLTINRSLNFNQKLSDAKQAVYYLLCEMNAKSLDQYDADEKKDDVIKNRFVSIFTKLGIERQIICSSDKLQLSTGAEGSEYDLEHGSDGERTAIYMIMAVLLLPENSFVFIDEPENHLNGALMRKLFDELETERKDVKFVYLTHNIDFIESRKNFELIYLEKTAEYMTWKFHKLSDLNDVPVDVILNIEGTKDDILFCEGDDRNSIDYRILKALFPNIEVTPVAGCEKVIANTRGLNGKQHIFRRNAFGVIDNDYRTQEEISALLANRINVLPYNEWENLLLDSEIASIINDNLFKKDFAEIKKHLVQTVNSRREAILSAYINKRYQKILSTSRFHYGDSLSEEIDAINNKNKISILDEVKNMASNFDKYVTENDYDSLLRIVSGKMFLGDISSELGCKDKSDYVEKFVDMIYTQRDFKELVLNKLALIFN